MIGINFLQHRRNYIDVWASLINRIKHKNKNKFIVNFLLSDNIAFNTSKFDFNHKVINFGGGFSCNNYKEKLDWSIGQPYEYYIIIGEDTFLGPSTWDFFIENTSILNDDKNLTLSPVLNLGVPTVDIFMEDFCTEEEISTLHKMFLSTDIYNTAGVRWCGHNQDAEEFRTLNQFTLDAKKWEPEKFLSYVDKMNWTLKGIHPIRFNYEAQCYLCDLVIQKIDKFLSPQNYEFDFRYTPYLCNEMSMIRTDIFKKIRDEFGFMPYDEPCLNFYKRKYNLNHVFVKRGFALHTLFAFVSRNLAGGDNKELDIFNRFTSAVNNYYKE
jgi:hypothetical protein